MSCFSSYCIYGTGYPYDGTYTSAGTHNSVTYWTGNTGYYIYYNNVSDQWCLSLTLDGPCLLSGKSPCGDQSCPDLCSDIFNRDICPTPTPTPTPQCVDFDFNAVFDCDFIPTPTPTPTTSSTPTPTPTPTSSSVCSIVSVDATISAVSPTPTPTMTVTPTNSGIISRLCNFSGDVTFDMVNIKINCPVSKEFKDCNNSGIRYYTGEPLTNPSGGTVSVDMVFEALVDGVTTCISYVGTNSNYGNINSIELVDYFGFYPTGCTACLFIPSPTPTPTPTMTETPGASPRPTPTPTPTQTSPSCFCYALVTSKVNTFTYTDCAGRLQTTGLTGNLGNPQINYICSRTQPTSNNLEGSATLSNACVGSSTAGCVVPTQCFCYKLENLTSSSKNFLYIDCQSGEFDLILIPGNSIGYVCSRIYPVLGSTFNGRITKQGSCTGLNDCQVLSQTPTRTPTPTPTPSRNNVPVVYEIQSGKFCNDTTQGLCNNGIIECPGGSPVTLYSTQQTQIIDNGSIYYGDSQLTTPYTGVLKVGNEIYSFQNGFAVFFSDDGDPC